MTASLPVRSISISRVTNRTSSSALVIAACDLCATLCAFAPLSLNAMVRRAVASPHGNLAILASFGIIITVFTALGLYPGVIHNSVHELRRFLVGFALCSLVSLFLVMASHAAMSYVPTIALLCFPLVMIFAPLFRLLGRSIVRRKRWWGVPIAVFHTGEESEALIRHLQKHPETGMVPVAILARAEQRVVHHLPVFEAEDAGRLIHSGVKRAAVVLPDTGATQCLQEVEQFASLFPRLMVMHTSVFNHSLNVNAHDVGGTLTVEVTKHLLFPGSKMVKRFLDLTILLIVGIVVIPLCLLICLVVKLDSDGPIFYGHRRIGFNNATFLAWKFRSMKVGADEILREALSSDQVLKEEWIRARKLKQDPRVTRFGRLLRKTSLDEIPQLWNVLRGEMSLVGPRPIVEEEIAHYGLHFNLYCQVSPGLTGLWQVSGRNNVSMIERVRLDSYYVRNWSPWLDLHILVRTAKAVFSGAGAY